MYNTINFRHFSFSGVDRCGKRVDHIRYINFLKPQFMKTISIYIPIPAIASILYINGPDKLNFIQNSVSFAHNFVRIFVKP